MRRRRMGQFQPPEGYRQDPATGQYFMQQMWKDAAGNTVLTTNWFNTETGQYTQTSAIIEKARRSRAPMIAVIVALVIVLAGMGVVIGYYTLSQKQEERGEDRYVAENDEDADGDRPHHTGTEGGKTGSGQDGDDSGEVGGESGGGNSASTGNSHPGESGRVEPEGLQDSQASGAGHASGANNSGQTANHENETADAASGTQSQSSGSATQSQGGSTATQTQGGGTSAQSQGSGTQQSGYSAGYVSGKFVCDTGGQFAPPVLILRDNRTFELTLNFTEGMNSYTGTYTISEKENEMDDVYVYLTINNPNNGIPGSATVCFSDSPDYCMFLDEGFGLMGYEGAPYYFWRED